MKQSLQKSLIWAVILSESSHVFCCVFPTLFSVVSLLAGIGVVAVMPTFMVSLHNTLHAWELPMIIVSGSILALGWAAIRYSDKIDCHSTGCAHGACVPKKNKAHLVLKIATILFAFNLFVYGAIHKSTWFTTHIAASVARSHMDQGHTHP